VVQRKRRAHAGRQSHIASQPASTRLDAGRSCRRSGRALPAAARCAVDCAVARAGGPRGLLLRDGLRRQRTNRGTSLARGGWRALLTRRSRFISGRTGSLDLCTVALACAVLSERRCSSLLRLLHRLCSLAAADVPAAARAAHGCQLTGTRSCALAQTNHTRRPRCMLGCRGAADTRSGPHPRQRTRRQPTCRSAAAPALRRLRLHLHRLPARRGSGQRRVQPARGVDKHEARPAAAALACVPRQVGQRNGRPLCRRQGQWGCRGRLSDVSSCGLWRVWSARRLSWQCVQVALASSGPCRRRLSGRGVQVWRVLGQLLSHDGVCRRGTGGGRRRRGASEVVCSGPLHLRSHRLRPLHHLPHISSHACDGVRRQRHRNHGCAPADAMPGL